jgi:hypothetical protein
VRVTEHQGFGHGLAPGTDQDINCGSCTSEKEQGVEPCITGSDDQAKEFPLDRSAAFTVLLEQPWFRGMEAREAENVTTEFLNDFYASGSKDMWTFCQSWSRGSDKEV